MRSADNGLRKLFFDNLPRFHWVPIETGLTVPGVPDANYCHEHAEGWLECKATKSLTVKFETFQPAWINRRAREGGRVFIAVRRQHGGGPRRGPPVDDLYIVSGEHVLALEARGLSAVPQVRWTNGPKCWSWPEIAEILLRPQR